MHSSTKTTAPIISATKKPRTRTHISADTKAKLSFMVEQAGINLKGLNVDKLKAEYQELMKQKSELTSTYKDCEKEVRELKRKQENLNQYLVRTQPDPAQEQQEKKDTPNL